ncbi:bifunctional hydroxymethylpyrimidine kinase/phosphomethylpyrimidine kinase [Treponema sp.]|uniref:bifunctional hydroxymethylpyrimidine kinase/phosphomethylpyrimidine kinase n=1 Tax=Treponema sp. TaxID=166 RepID=UPI00257F5C6B|nr:bifunctional hydroxymethylpyrimidine kinase/phosphomethylpyrimidine kinase [Treponema sp.]
MVRTLSESIKTALTIAGSDCSGGAGIQADLKTFAANGVYGMSVITALTAQNTTGVYGIKNTEPEFVKKQIDCVFTDIRPDSVKIGMAGSSETIDVISQVLAFYSAKNIVVDPVMVSTAGTKLLDRDSVSVLTKKLFPLATLVTPNIPEAEIICGLEIAKPADMEKAAAFIYEVFGCSVLIKGGHLTKTADDFLLTEGKGEWLYSERIDNPDTHGTGCTLSSAISANLSLGYSLKESVKNAKAYITGAIKSMMCLGKGSGPLNHLWNINIAR